jgi:hypothetical protein
LEGSSKTGLDLLDLVRACSDTGLTGSYSGLTGLTNSDTGLSLTGFFAIRGETGFDAELVFFALLNL